MIFNRMLNQGMAVAAVSLVVSLLTHPFYMVAERWQKTERDDRARLEQKLKKIKAVFSGDERHMMITAYYRQNRYHPLYSLRNSIGLLIQIPFFMAAYICLSRLEVLKGAPFLFIKDLGSQDALLALPGIGRVNLLPIAMTLINAVSAAVYTRQSGSNGAGQLYLMAAVFLVLLYNSPAGLVLYWTCNNLFSLVKNIAATARLSGRIVRLFVCVITVSAALYLLFVFDKGYYAKRAALAGCFILACLYTCFAPLAKKAVKKYLPLDSPAAQNGVDYNAALFAASALILCLIAGLAIPSALIASSVEEFSFITPYTTPNPFLAKTALRAAGFFLLWPFAVYALFSRKVKFYGTMLLAAAGWAALIDAYAFAGDYGFLNVTLTLSNDDFSQTPFMVAFEAALLLLAAGGCAFLFARKRKWLLPVQAVLLVSLAGFSVFNIVKIQRDFSRYAGTVARANLTDGGGGDCLNRCLCFPEQKKTCWLSCLTGRSPLIFLLFSEKSRN
jgi:YidC/Oxa1 family membrane protein insertase